jgi:hypothetical protein
MKESNVKRILELEAQNRELMHKLFKVQCDLAKMQKVVDAAKKYVNGCQQDYGAAWCDNECISGDICKALAELADEQLRINSALLESLTVGSRCMDCDHAERIAKMQKVIDAAKELSCNPKDRTPTCDVLCTSAEKNLCNALAELDKA